jgi:hypothetical protein
LQKHPCKHQFSEEFSLKFTRFLQVDEHYNIKISDFGLSRIIEKRYYVSDPSRKLPWKWTAPEALETRKFDSKADGKLVLIHVAYIVLLMLGCYKCGLLVFCYGKCLNEV